MDVRVTPEAAEYARAKGGVIYIWANDSSLLEAKVKPPAGAEASEGDKAVVDGIEVRISPTAPKAMEWLVGFVRFPWKRLVATSNFTGSGAQDMYGSGLT
jgi:hypothetical protein